MNTEINPDSIMVRQADGQWQKFAAFILWKLKGREVVKITAEDMKAMAAEFEPGMAVVLVHGHSDSIDFSIVDEAAAHRIAAHSSTMRGSA